MGGGEERPDKDGPELGLILLTVTTITSQSVRSQSLCLIKLQGQTEGERGRRWINYFQLKTQAGNVG